MIDRYLTCPRVGCGGVAERLGADSRNKNAVYRCEKCGNTFTISRSNFDFGRYALQLSDPNDPLRGGLK